MLKLKVSLSNWVAVAVIGLLVPSHFAWAESKEVKGAQPMDPATVEALQKTQKLLTDPSQRAEAIKTDAKAKANDQKVQALLGSDSGKAYELSSQILEKLVAKTNGDPKALQALLNELMSNPQKLEEYMDANQREQIRGMASRVEQRRGMTPSEPKR